jgi:hypothetical protein
MQVVPGRQSLNFSFLSCQSSSVCDCGEGRVGGLYCQLTNLLPANCNIKLQACHPLLKATWPFLQSSQLDAKQEGEKSEEDEDKGV